MKRHVKSSSVAMMASLLLSACGGTAPEQKAEAETPAFTLASDPIRQAAQCQAAAMAEAQSRPDFAATGMTRDELDRVLHPAYLGATGSGAFDTPLMQKISDQAIPLAHEWRGKPIYRAVQKQCGEHLPMTVAGSFKALPKDDADARAMCVSLAGALVETYQQTEGADRASIPTYGALIQDLQEDVIRDRWKAGDADEAAIQSSLRQALARAVRLGPPGEVMKACQERFTKK